MPILTFVPRFRAGLEWENQDEAWSITKPLPSRHYVASNAIMRGRFTSLFLLFGLFLSVIVAPVIAHASDHDPVRPSELASAHEADLSVHEHHEGSDHQGSDDEQPCHAVSHHHCGLALSSNAPRVTISGISKSLLAPPASSAPKLSRSQAPPLNPPKA
jgi:hypothetical protein